MENPARLGRHLGAGLLLLATAAGAADVAVVPKKLIVIDKLAAKGKARLAYVAKDAAVTKGTGTDVNQIGVEFLVRYGNGSAAGAFTLPAGASDGTAGWRANKPTVARYVNASAPDGATQAKVALVKPGKLLKLVGKGLGDEPLAVLPGGDPGAGGVQTAYCVTNGAETSCHCSTFSSCAYALVAQGSGAKLVCKTGTGDGDCAARPPATTTTSSTTVTTTSTIATTTSSSTTTIASTTSTTTTTSTSSTILATSTSTTTTMTSTTSTSSSTSSSTTTSSSTSSSTSTSSSSSTSTSTTTSTSTSTSSTLVCPPGFCDEDGIPTTGCERDLDTNPVCPAEAVAIGAVSGDTPGTSVVHSDQGEKWLRVAVTEDDSAFECEDLGARITLEQPPGGGDYDLHVFCDDCTTQAGVSQLGGSATDLVDVRWQEQCIAGFPSGSDSGRLLFIRVQHFLANVCDEWTLTVAGDVLGGAITCTER